MHLACGNEFKRHDLNGELAATGQAVGADANALGLARRFLFRHDLVEVVSPHDRSANQLQDVLERRQNGRPRQWPAGLQCDRAVDLRVNGVIQVEHFAHNDARDIAHAGVSEAEDDIAAVGHGDRRARYRLRIYERAGAEIDLRRALWNRSLIADPRHHDFARYRGLLVG